MLDRSVNVGKFLTLRAPGFPNLQKAVTNPIPLLWRLKATLPSAEHAVNTQQMFSTPSVTIMCHSFTRTSSITILKGI